MRLLALEPHPSYVGGSETVAVSLSMELAARGHHLILLHDSAGPMIERYARFCERIIRRDLPGVSLRSPGQTLMAANRVKQVLEENRIDAAFSANVGCLESAALVSWISGVQFCFHLGLPFSPRSNRFRLTLRRTGFGVAPSEHTAATWRRAGWAADRLSVVPNWVDTRRFSPSMDRPALRARLGLPADGKCIAFLGRFCPEKGVGDLLSAFGQVRAEVDAATLVLVGEPAAHYHLELNSQLSELDAGCRAQTLCFAATQYPEEYLAASDIVCVPSWEEPFGLVVLEAMACGVPVVATSVGVFPHLLGPQGAKLLVPPRDSTALAERLVWCLCHPSEAKEIGACLRRRAVEHFGPTKSVSAYESVLQVLASNKGG